MKIDWFTVIAQVINFLILVWLLKKFLYKPILYAVNEREKKISAELKDAAAKKTDAQKEQDDFKKKNDDFDTNKKELIDKAVADANVEKEKLITAAKADANALGTSMEKEFKEKQDQDKKDIAQNTQKQIFSITRKALTELASVSLEAQSVDAFIKHLNAATKEEKKKFIDAFKVNANAILVRSAFDLPEKLQSDITDAVNELLNTKTNLKFKTAPELISGIELSTDGYKIEWSFSEYLNELQKNISSETKQKEIPQKEKDHDET
ncbi:F0F1 ATP synthase subunit B family protein [Kaistella jeonii]|uniref:ATP synthase subunit b n=1 Tax=Kaistella jeonii TaxID=266749 RepID=A0A0C1EYU7_9FLAO|nr:ATP synthase subunit B [Kaistella jeonii]KIA86012.1 ATP synthase subunit B [Kaistella jeonii]SFC36960.1 F-type H+-transporting ATPase subunit b [Kaistella jeonii]VEI97276.1 F-type ATPase subunit b [Kaistella jeonii]